MYRSPDKLVVLDADGTTMDASQTMATAFLHHGIDNGTFDFLACIPLADDKATPIRTAHRFFDINPARAYACGDEHRDYDAAVSRDMHPLIASCGFENAERLIDGFGVPASVVADSPAELASRLARALDLP